MAKCSQIQKHVHMWIHAEHLVSLTGEQWAGTGWSCNQMSSCVSLPTGTAVCLAFYFTGQCHRHAYCSMHARTHMFIPQNVQAKGRIWLKIGNERCTKYAQSSGQEVDIYNDTFVRVQSSGNIWYLNHSLKGRKMIKWMNMHCFSFCFGLLYFKLHAITVTIFCCRSVRHQRGLGHVRGPLQVPHFR